MGVLGREMARAAQSGARESIQFRAETRTNRGDRYFAAVAKPRALSPHMRVERGFAVDDRPAVVIDMHLS